eukprot:83750-Prymnesium_polylepis.2
MGGGLVGIAGGHAVAPAHDGTRSAGAGAGGPLGAAASAERCAICVPIVPPKSRFSCLFSRNPPSEGGSHRAEVRAERPAPGVRRNAATRRAGQARRT